MSDQATLDGGEKGGKTWNAERKMKTDYFKNRILTLIQAEMWKILISFEK